MNIPKELKVFAKDLSILIVEDDILLNNQLVEIAQLFFKDVRFALNGEDGLQSYTQNNADIVVTDITMPKLNGIEMSKKIRYINNEQSIIIISAHCHLDYITEIVDIGIKQFIRKPFDDSELLYRLLKVSEEIVLLKATKEEHIKKTKELPRKEEIAVIKQITPPTDTNIQESLFYRKKLNANSFKNTFEHDIHLDIEYLLELSEDFEKYIDFIYAHKLQPEYLLEIIFILKKMYTTISQMSPLVGMSLVIFDLASFLETLNVDTLDDAQKEKLNILEFIQQDISKFLTSVFVDENVTDIHYLEDSLKSSIDQLKQSILNIQIDEQEFELF